MTAQFVRVLKCLIFEHFKESVKYFISQNSLVFFDNCECDIRYKFILGI